MIAIVLMCLMFILKCSMEKDEVLMNLRSVPVVLAGIHVLIVCVWKFFGWLSTLPASVVQ